MARFMTLPALHAAWTGIFGFFIAQAYFKQKIFLFWLGWIISAGLHGLYNTCSSDIRGVAIASFCIFALLSLVWVELKRKPTGS